MQIKDMVKVCALLVEAGMENEYFDSDHDIIFIPCFEREGELATKLDELGCHWNSSSGCWAHY